VDFYEVVFELLKVMRFFLQGRVEDYEPVVLGRQYCPILFHIRTKTICFKVGLIAEKFIIHKLSVNILCKFVMIRQTVPQKVFFLKKKKKKKKIKKKFIKKKNFFKI